MIDRAMATISEKQSSWRPTELLRELAQLVPTDMVVRRRRLVEWLDKLADHVVDNYCIDVSKPIEPDALLRKDGRPSPSRSSTVRSPHRRSSTRKRH